MKKLIAMLLCLALVASFGVTSAFALTFTNADSADMYWNAVADKEGHVARMNANADMATAVEEILYDYDMACWKAHQAGLTGKAYDMAVATARSDAQLALKALSATDAKAAAAVKNAAGYDVFNIDVLLDNGDYNQLDGIISNFKATAAAEQDAADWFAVYAKYYQKLADDEAAAIAEKEAIAAAEKALAEKIAKATKGIDASTPAGKLLYDATVSKMFAEESLTAAKKAAETAKKAIAVAQKGAYTDAQAAILNAQAFAYNQLASDINTAVEDYVDSVYVAIADFYAELYA